MLTGTSSALVSAANINAIKKHRIVAGVVRRLIPA